jgi:hypothetical protein
MSIAMATSVGSLTGKLVGYLPSGCFWTSVFVAFRLPFSVSVGNNSVGR